jgi:cytochrome c oxidase assembly protein subunit 15
VQLPEPSTRPVLRLAQAALMLNVLLVLSGAAVRLTGSGLGCPTWPRCTGGSVVNTPALGVNGYIEFGNRLLAVLLEVVGVALVVAVLRLRRPRPDGWIRLATVQVLVVPLQAVIGGLLVLSHLNPYVLILHFLVSFPLITAAAMLLARVVTPGARMRRGHPELRWLTGALVSAAALVLVLGTVVTGTGPHAGSRDIARLPFDPREVTQLHADGVFLLVGLTLALALVGPALGAPTTVRRKARTLLAVIAAQAVLGYLQYFLAVPPALVALHVLGAAVVFTLAVTTHLATTSPPRRAAQQPQQVPATLARSTRLSAVD